MAAAFGLAATVATAARAQAFDRTQPPALGPAPELSLPPITERTLPNGLRLIVAERHELPLVEILLVIRAGGEADPPGQTGIASLVTALLPEGAGNRTSFDIAEQQAFLGVRIGAFASWDQSLLSVRSPTAVLDSALALFADVALRPTFPQSEFDRVKQQRLTQLLQVLDRPPAMADRAINAIIFGDDHPYGRSLQGVEPTVEALTRDHVAAFHRRVYRPDNAFIVVAGAVTPADIERRLAALFGAWERGAAPPATVAGAMPAPAARRIYVVDKPDAPQASFRIGTVGVARNTDDFYAIAVMNTILGGAFTSRLNMTLREIKGYTYGAGSAFSMRREAGPFLARSEIVAARADSALLDFISELEKIREPVPAEELDKARQYLQLGLPAGFETAREVAGQLAQLALYGRPLDEPLEAVRRIGAVTAADVQRVAQRYINPETLAIVIVGDAATLVPMLERTGVAPVELRDSYGRPVVRQ